MNEAIDFSMPKKTLAAALARVKPFGVGRSVFAAHGFVRIRAKDKRVTFTATNMKEVTIFHSDGEVHSNGSCVVAVKDLGAIVKSAGGKDLRLSNRDDKALDVVSGKTTARLPIHSVSFPSFPDRSSAIFVEIDAASLSRAMDAVSKFMSVDDTRPHLAGMKLEWGAGEVRAIATDGHRMAVAIAKTISSLSGLELLVPYRSAAMLRKFIKDNANRISIASSGKELVARGADGSEFSCVLADEQFPPYQKVIPTTTDVARVEISRVDALDVAKRVAAASPRVGAGVWLECVGSTMKIKSAHGRTECCTIDEELPIKLKGSGRGVGMNPMYLVDALAALDTERVAIVIRGELDPLVLMPIKGDLDVTMVVMPMRTR